MSCFLGDTVNSKRALKIQKELRDLNITLNEVTGDMDELRAEFDELCLTPSERQWVRLQQEYEL